ncbi:hypothetical protein LB467_09850 [Salegentibacter sp. JZCK2]|uniref:hypothetical protein n=1 Tax=Salegentibacter tibetensis TaxID=2873600 RepID=UPI001CCE03BC|nr:hypothetical protein [Salegentibacter tibetensis]MBZ9729988.1 hypothetical protein [Salegentibacter tibetensis]
MNNKQIIITENHSDIVESQVQKITEFLADLGLPSDNIIASNQERGIINQTLPGYISQLPVELKKDARYLSKFVVGAGFGLFDYALNSIWNEVTLALRNKAITYGLDIFFDASVGGKMRELYNSEEDLAGLKDNTLLNTCKKLELISETTYKKLAHILDMRNDIGISHPTNYTINAFELMGWFQTCIQDVLQDMPSDSAIQVKAFIQNLKNLEQTIEDDKVEKIKGQISSLSSLHCSRILRTIFGLYVSEDSSQILRKNISKIIPIVWNASIDDVKYKIGIILEGYNNNLHTKKYEKGCEFFEIANGNKYRTESERVINLENLSNELREAHYAYDNYYHEVPVIKKIMTYFEDSTDIPNEVALNLIHSVMLCRIGRGLSYKRGVSPSGKVYYDRFFNMLKDDFIPLFIAQLCEFDIQQKLSRKISMEQALEMISEVKHNIINERYIESLDYLLEKFPNTERAIFNTEFKKLTSGFLTWEKK